MPRQVETITISLPKQLSRRVRKLQQREGKTMSEFIRSLLQAFDHRSSTTTLSARRWEELKKDLQKLRSSGKRRSLSEFVINDRAHH